MRIQKDSNTQDVVMLVNSFGKLKGWKLYWELLKWVFTGIFMGTSDAIPGYSGGTTLALLGFFKRLILVAKSVFVPEPGLTRKKALMFMLPFASGWMCGVFGFAKLTEYMAEHGMGLELLFFFSAFIAFAIPVFLKSEDPKLKQKDKHQKRRWMFLVAGFLLVLGLALWTFLSNKGVSFDVKENIKDHFDLQHEWHKLVLVAFGAGAVTLIPGGSGAIVQLLSGFYPKIHWVIMGHASSNFGALAVFGVSTFMGMLMMVFLFSWVFKHWEKELAALSFGMLLASIAAVLLVPERGIWNNLNDWRHILGVCSALILGSITAVSIQFIIKRSHLKKGIKN